MTGEWAIDIDSAIQAIEKYSLQLDLIQSGASLKEAGVFSNRELEKSQIITPSNSFVSLDGESEIPGGSIARVQLSGVMQTEGGLSSRGVKDIANEIRTLSTNENIDGILLEVNSGGGEALSGYILSNAIQDAKSNGTPVVTLAHYLGSAAVHGTLKSNEIIASSQGSKIGSIGSFLTVSRNFADFYNENFEDIYSDNSPEKNLEFREYLKGNKKPLKDLVNKSDNQFMNAVKRERPLKGNIEETLKGGMFSANSAKRRGLIDGIGSMNYALKRLRSHINYNKNKS